MLLNQQKLLFQAEVVKILSEYKIQTTISIKVVSFGGKSKLNCELNPT